MWVGGDLLFLTAMILAVWVWLRAEENEGRLADARLDRDLARAATAQARAATALPTASASAAAPVTRNASQTSGEQADPTPDPVKSRT